MCLLYVEEGADASQAHRRAERARVAESDEDGEEEPTLEEC